MPSRFWKASGNALLLSRNSFAVSAAAGTVWASNADFTLTNSNLTAQRTATTTFYGFELTSVAKTNWTAIFTVNAMGSATNNYIGADDGTETVSPGGSGTGHSIFWRQDGPLIFGGAGIATLATWTTGDQLKIVKSGALFTFYKMITGTWTQQGSTIDTSSASYGVGTVLAGNVYASLASFNATGFQVTADFNGF